MLITGWLLGFAAANGQEAKPEKEPGDAVPPAIEAAVGAEGLCLRLETWETTAMEVAKRFDGVKSAEDLAKLRSEFLAGSPGVSLALSHAINVSSLTKVTGESVTERIFPTEYEPPELTCSPQSSPPPGEMKPPTFGGWIEDLAGHAVPTSFETRNTGTTLDANVSAVAGQEKVWNTSINVEDVRYLSFERFGADTLGIGMPVYSRFRSNGELRMKEGQWQVLSIMEPPRSLDSKPSDKRWITMVRLDAHE